MLLRAAQAPNGPDEPPEHRAWPGPQQAHVRALDVATVLAALPRSLRRVAEALKTCPIAAAARHLRMSRTTLYARLAELRFVFTAAGLDDFFPDRRTPRARRG